jgi:hypothetical protein
VALGALGCFFPSVEAEDGLLLPVGALAGASAGLEGASASADFALACSMVFYTDVRVETEVQGGACKCWTGGPSGRPHASGLCRLVAQGITPLTELDRDLGLLSFLSELSFLPEAAGAGCSDKEQERSPRWLWAARELRQVARRGRRSHEDPPDAPPASTSCQPGCSWGLRGRRRSRARAFWRGPSYWWP